MFYKMTCSFNRAFLYFSLANLPNISPLILKCINIRWYALIQAKRVLLVICGKLYNNTKIIFQNSANLSSWDWIICLIWWMCYGKFNTKQVVSMKCRTAPWYCVIIYFYRRLGFFIYWITLTVDLKINGICKGNND